MAGEVAQGIDHEFTPQYCKKKQPALPARRVNEQDFKASAP
jgi:hypothetical protein